MIEFFGMKAFLQDESGATSIEYALIAAILSLAIVTGVTNVKTELQGTFTDVQVGFQGALN